MVELKLMNPKPIIVLSVGGSLIVPDKIDTDFLTNFRNLILKNLPKYRFIIISGGGKTARRYQDAAKAVVELSDEDADWLGIHSTRLNAHLLRTIFRDEAHSQIITDPAEEINFTENILVGAGWRPGRSTDYVAVLIAKRLGATTIINLSNIDYVYDGDPRTNPRAKKIENITWSEFRKLIPKEWSPGLSSPFDPIASREAEKLGLEVVVMNGNKLENLEKYLEGRVSAGTKINS